MFSHSSYGGRHFFIVAPSGGVVSRYPIGARDNSLALICFACFACLAWLSLALHCLLSLLSLTALALASLATLAALAFLQNTCLGLRAGVTAESFTNFASLIFDKQAEGMSQASHGVRWRVDRGLCNG